MRCWTVSRAHAAALDLVEADLDGLAVVLLLALVDRDVVHPHPVLLRHRRGVGQAHGIAVVENLAARRRPSVAASSPRARTTPLRPRRPGASRGPGHPAWAAPTKTARRSDRGNRGLCARRPARQCSVGTIGAHGRQARSEPIACRRADDDAKSQNDRGSKATHASLSRPESDLADHSLGLALTLAAMLEASGRPLRVDLNE